MVAPPPAQVYSAVHPVAAQYGVPDPIWETVAYMESGYNPNAVGDAGTSFGLFQLHEGGQLRTSPASVSGTSGIPQNALEAMPQIGGAWSNLKTSFNPSSLDWWTQFAAQSGHPGGGPGNVATQNAAQAMLNDYSGTTGLANYNTSQIPNYSGSTNTSQCPAYCAVIPFQAFGPCSNCDPVTNNQSTQSTLSTLVSGDFWARAGVFILGGVILLFGMMKLLK
jgi:hypothetical protein